MPTYIITCPICKKQYKIASKDSTTLARKTFSCPSCRYSAPFSSLIKELNAPQPITRPENIDSFTSNQQIHPATKVSSNLNAQLRVYLTVLNNNARFILNPGIYILGRKSSDSTATLQLAPDISMSRQHARLSVQLVGGRPMAQVVGLKANNPVIINGKVSAVGHPYTLKQGDKLQLGMTTIVFSI